MTDKEYQAYKYLSRLWRIKREIQDKEDELRSACLASGIRYDKLNVQTSPSDPMDKVSDLISDIQTEKEEYLQLQHTMINQIHGLEDHVYEPILVDRFIHNRPVKQICIRHNYPKTTGYRLFLEALDAFSDKYGTKWE